MSFSKVDYVDSRTPIRAKNLNEIQNEIIRNGSDILNILNDVNDLKNSGANILWAEYNVTTSSEIAAAIANKKIVALKYENRFYYLTSILQNVGPTGTAYLFRSEDRNANYQIVMFGEYWNPKTTITYPKASSDLPSDLGDEATPGISEDYARADHVHKIPSEINTLQNQIGQEISDLHNELSQDIDNLQTELDQAVDSFAIPTQEAVNAWLNAHPEASTTVQDGTISMSKLTSDVKYQIAFRTNHNYKYDSSLPEGTATFAELFQKVKNEVMDEYKGNIDKIPFILCTDPHGSLSSYPAVFQAISSCVNWYDVSKFFNLGDTVTSTWGTFTESTDEFTTNWQLESMINMFAPIPMDKQVNVFGNHDTWCRKSGENGYRKIPLNLLAPYFRNAQGHRMSNGGYFSVRDDYFNVKYIVVSGFEYPTGDDQSITVETASTKQIAWLINELGIDDGYDIVMVCHEPLFPDWAGRSFESQYAQPSPSATSINNSNRWAWLNTDDIFLARKNKTSGSFVDVNGVTHVFDYSGLTGNLLCGLDGHLHYDCSQYTGNDELLCESFGSFKAENGGFLYFGLIDRENSRLNIWKICHTGLYYENYQVPFSISANAETYSIKRRMKNTSTYQISNTIRAGQVFYDVIIPASGKTVGTVKVLMGGVDVTSDYYNPTTHVIRIPAVSGDIDITAYDTTTDESYKVWVVRNILENAETNKPTVYSDEYYEKPICVNDGSSFSEIPDITGRRCVYDFSATMGGADVLTNNLTSSRTNMSLTIPSVTNDVDIVCKACDVNNIVGLLRADGTVDETQTEWNTSTFVPIDGATIGSVYSDPGSTVATSYVAYYDENQVFLCRVYSSSRTSTLYVPVNARFVRVSQKGNHGFVLVPNRTISNATVTINATGMTLGEYPSTIRKGNALVVPFTLDGEGSAVVDSCTAGGSAVSYSISGNSLIVPYTPGDVVVTMHLKPRVLFNLPAETALSSSYNTNVQPALSYSDSFTVMLDFTIDTTPSANNTFFIRFSGGSGGNNSGLWIRRHLAGINSVEICYSSVTHELTLAELTVAVGTRCKIVATHAGGASSYVTNFYFKTANMADPFTYSLTSPSGSGYRRITDATASIGSGNATITYHGTTILSEVATQQEIDAFLAFE